MAKGILKRHLKQKIVWWEKTGNSGQGKGIFNDAVQIKGRWVDKREKFTDQSGEEKISRAIIITDRDVNMGDYLYLGNISVLPSDTSDPYAEEVQEESYEIKAKDKIPIFEGTQNKIKVYL